MTTIVFSRNDVVRRIRTTAPQTAIIMYTNRDWTVDQIIFM
jgi:hypothetical protein